MLQVSVLATVEATVFTQVSFKFVWSYNSFIINLFSLDLPSVFTLKSHKSFGSYLHVLCFVRVVSVLNLLIENI